MVLNHTGQDNEGWVIFRCSDEVHPLKYHLYMLSDFRIHPLCDFWRTVCSALPNFLINLLLFNQLSGSLLNFSHLLIYCECWGYAQKLSNSMWTKWRITIIMIEKRGVPRHTEELEETNVYIKASLNGRLWCCREKDTPKKVSQGNLPGSSHVVAGSASPQDKIFSLIAHCLGPWCWPQVTKPDSICTFTTNLHVIEMCLHNC